MNKIKSTPTIHNQIDLTLVDFLWGGMTLPFNHIEPLNHYEASQYTAAIRVEYPPTFIMILGIISLFFVLQQICPPASSFKLELGTDFIEIGHLDCEKIRELMVDPEFYIKLSKENLADSMKKLLECNLLDFKKDREFFNRFTDWENFYSKYPEILEEIGSLLKIEEMSTYAVQSLPVPFILEKIKTFDGLINKLPMKKILNHLSSDKTDSELWKLFTEPIFVELTPIERNILMEYLSKITLTSDEDLILLLIRTGNFLISIFMSLKDGRLWNLDDDDGWIEKYANVESVLNDYLELRRKLKERTDISEIIRSFIDSPISKNLKDAIEDALTKKADADVINLPIKLQKARLSNFLLTPKPFDPNSFTDEGKLTKLAVPLLKFYKFENLIESESLTFEEFEEKFKFIKNPVILLDFLRSFSNDPIFILKVFKSVPAVYTEKFPVCEWIKKAFEIGSPELLNFIYFNYKNLVKNEISELIEEAKKEESINCIGKFFLDTEIEDELKFCLLLPSGLKDILLKLDFIDLEHYSDLDTGKMEFLKEAFKFHLDESKRIKSKKLKLKFRNVNGQDTGGLSRHFLMTIFRILIDEKFGLFHILNDGKVVPRTLLDVNVLGFIGMLHGQALKASLKVPWLIDFSYENQPIKLVDLIKELERNSEDGLVPSCEDILNYLNEKYRLFEDRFDFSGIEKCIARVDSKYLQVLEKLEKKFWKDGEEAYRVNLIYAADREIVTHVLSRYGNDQIIFDEILNLLKPLKSSEIDPNEFLNCFTFTGGAKDLIKNVVEVSIRADPMEMIPAVLKFVTGAIELPPAGLSSLNLVVNTFVAEKHVDRRLPQASTCQKIINWTISSEESEEELIERFKTAIKESKGFELE